MLKILLDHMPLEDDVPALAALHQKGRLAFKALPDKKTEAYKYTDIQGALTVAMLERAKKTCIHADDGMCHCHAHEKSLPFEAYEFHFCNGCLHKHFHFIEGVEVMSLRDAVKEHEASRYINKFDLENYAFAALNTAYADEGLFIKISQNIDRPIVLFYHHDTNLMSHIRNIIVLEKGAKAEVVEIYQGDEAAYFHNIVNEIFISKDALLRHYKLQNEGKSAVHVALSNVQVKESGAYESFCLQKGAKAARNETHVLLKEQNARALVNAAYLGVMDKLIDTTTDIEHLSPLTNSNQIVRGVVSDKAHGVFQGKIHIFPHAVQTEGYQIHKALMLSDDALLDVKPALEIFADDVKCSHGSTCGDLNEDELFYLRSRGIAEDEARQILIKAFLCAAFDDIENQDIKNLFDAF